MYSETEHLHLAQLITSPYYPQELPLANYPQHRPELEEGLSSHVFAPQKQEVHSQLTQY